MWYVIQTRTGFENELVMKFRENLSKDLYKSFLVPMFEDVMRTGGESHISNRRLFPGYILVDTDTPEEIIHAHNKLGTREFVRLLGMEDKDEDILIKPISDEDADFLGSILENGIMSVSYVETEKGTKVKRIIGPLAKYGNHITKIELRCRRAIVDAFVFGKRRRIKFGLWTNEDPEIPWIREALRKEDRPEYILENFDIGIYPGDRVRDVTGTYTDEIFEVEKVNLLKRTIKTRGIMFGEIRNIELQVDKVEKV